MRIPENIFCNIGTYDIRKSITIDFELYAALFKRACDFLKILVTNFKNNLLPCAELNISYSCIFSRCNNCKHIAGRHNASRQIYFDSMVFSNHLLAFPQLTFIPDAV